MIIARSRDVVLAPPCRLGISRHPPRHDLRVIVIRTEVLPDGCGVTHEGMKLYRARSVELTVHEFLKAFHSDVVLAERLLALSRPYRRDGQVKIWQVINADIGDVRLKVGVSSAEGGSHSPAPQHEVR